MKKFVLLWMAALCFSGLITAQETDTTKNWSHGGFGALNLNQVAFVNWAQGGDNSFSVMLVGNAFANYKKDKLSWDNNFDGAYGLQRAGKVGFRKNEDKFELQSKLGYEAAKEQFFYTLLANFRSQFANGFNFPNDSTVVSRFAAPAFLLVSAGVDYKPVDYFSLFLSPATGKFTIVRDQILADLGSFGVDPAVYAADGVTLIENGKRFRAEFGAYLNMRFQKDIIKNVNLITKLDLFNNYTDKNKPNRKNIDINWETNITLKVNKFLSASIITHLIYDHDISVPVDDTGDGNPDRSAPRTQFREALGVGLSYKF